MAKKKTTKKSNPNLSKLRDDGFTSEPKGPVSYAVGMKRVTGNSWSAVLYQIQDGKVINEECAPDDLFPVAVENVKMLVSEFFEYPQ